MSLSALIYNRNSQETADTPKSEYTQILENVQQYMSQEHGAALSEALTEDDAQATVLGLIQKYITDQKLMVSGMSVEELARRLHTDMCGFSVLDRYLHDPEVEEINVNRYDDIEILYHDRWEKSPSKFATPQQAQDIARRLVHCSGKVLDASTPAVDAHTEAGVRIHAAIPPVIAIPDGATISIRKQTASSMTTQDMVKSGVATEEMLDFLKLCLGHGISVGIAGETGCGKTTDVAYLLNSLPHHLRIITIEDTRELVIHPVYDEDGCDRRRYIQECTRLSDDPRLSITMGHLVRNTLRQHPDVIAVAEMRGPEAMDAYNCAESGHTIITTFHARSAQQAYMRILSMCQMNEQAALPPHVLMQNIVELFPVMVYKVTMGDGKRRIYEIVEAVSCFDSRPAVNPLFRYDLKSGTFQRMGAISQRLAERMRIKGADEAQLARFLAEPV